MVAGKKTVSFPQDEMVAILLKCRPEAANARNLGKTNLGGVIFGCKNSTIKECLVKQLFGLPAQHFSYVRNISPGLPLFLFNYSDRKLYGIFEAASSGQMNIDPYAWTSGGTDRTQYPAQVQVRTKLQCQPLSEKQFMPIISDNYFSSNHFWFELDHAQTNKLISKLSTMAFAPGRFPLHFVNKSSLKSLTFPLENKRDKNGSHELPVPEKVESLYHSDINFSGSQSSVPSDGQEMLLESFLADPVSDREEMDLIYKQLKELYINRESENASMRARAIENSAGSDERLPKEFPQAEQAVSEENGKNPGSSLESPDFPSIIAQLREEVNELKAFKEEQVQKTEHMKMRLLEAEEEICELKNRCMILESISRPSMVHLDAVGFESLDNLHLDFDESVFLVGGYDGVSWLSALDLYCPSQDILKTLKPMAAVRSYSSVAKLNGELYVFGGGNGSLWYDTVESYNPVNNQWSLCPSMNEKKGSLAGAMLDNKIFAIGGGNGVECFSDVEMYDVNVGSWIPTQSMLEKRFALAAAEVNGAIYAVGGYDGNNYLKSAERFDPRDHSWRRIDSMNVGRGCHSMVVMNEKLYALGGFDESSMSRSVEIYDPRLGRWMDGEPMNESRGYLAAAVLKESIYVIGGVKSGEDIIDTVEHYKEGQGWQVTNSRGAGRRCFCSAIVLGQD